MLDISMDVSISDLAIAGFVLMTTILITTFYIAPATMYCIREFRILAERQRRKREQQAALAAQPITARIAKRRGF